MVWVKDDSYGFQTGYPEEKKFPWWLLLLAIPILFLKKKI